MFIFFFKFYESIDTINIRREISTNPYITVVDGSGPLEYFLSWFMIVSRKTQIAIGPLKPFEIRNFVLVHPVWSVNYLMVLNSFLVVELSIWLRNHNSANSVPTGNCILDLLSLAEISFLVTEIRVLYFQV